jgi:hypothetical protein
MAITVEWDVYVAGALSALSPEEYLYVTTKVYERVQNVCKKIQLTCYLPQKSQTYSSKTMPHTKVWEVEYKRVLNSGVIVAYVGIPSCGVGAEIEMARTANVPVILLFETNKLEELSQLILGNPAIKYKISFNQPQDIDNQLTDALIMIFSEKNLETEAFEKHWSFEKWEAMHKQLLSTEKTMQREGFFRNFRQPISKDRWSRLGQDWDKKNRNKNGRIDDF